MTNQHKDVIADQIFIEADRYEAEQADRENAPQPTTARKSLVDLYDEDDLPF